jgi:hypothetical protein
MTDPTGLPAQSGPQEGRCGAVKAKDADGNPIRWCRKYPRRGGIRCEDDGGNSPQALAAAERRVAHQAAERAVQTLGLRRDIGPEDALLEELQWTAGHVAWLRERVQELEPQELVWGVTEEKDVGSGEHPGVDTTSAAAPNVWWELYRQERKHLLAVIHEANTAKIDQRRIKLAEEQGALVAGVIRRSFDKVLDALVALGLAQALAEAWPGLVRGVVTGELRALSGGEPT